MDSDWHIDKADVLGTNCLRALGELLARTDRLESMIREGAEVSIHPDRLPRRVVLAAQHLRDWGLNAEAEGMTDLWDRFYSEWTSSTADYDESLPNLLGNLNQWLGDRLQQWMVSAGCTLGDLERNEVKPPASQDEKTPQTIRKGKRARNGPNIEQTKAFFVALLTILPQEDHAAITSGWSASDIRTAMADKLELDTPPTTRTIQRMLVADGYRPPKNAKPVSGDYDGMHWDDPNDPRQRQVIA